MKLDLRSVNGGNVIDTITVAGADVQYGTGAATSIVESAARRQGTTVAEAAAGLDGWSNGYVIFEAAKARPTADNVAPVLFARTKECRAAYLRNSLMLARSRKTADDPYAAVMDTLWTLRSRLSGELRRELDVVIGELTAMNAGGENVSAHLPGRHDQSSHGRKRTGKLGSVLEKLEALRDKLGDDDRSLLDQAMDQLRGLESSDVDDDDLIDEEPDEPDEEDEDTDLVMDSASGELSFTSWADGDVTVDWDDGNIVFTQASGREVADAVERFAGLPTVEGPELPAVPEWVKTQEDYRKWYSDWVVSSVWDEYNAAIGEFTTSDGDLKVARYGSGVFRIGDPELVDDEDATGLLDLDNADEGREFAGMLREALTSAAPAGVQARLRAHGTHDQRSHGRKKTKKADTPAEPGSTTDAAAPAKAPKKAVPKKQTKLTAPTQQSFTKLTPERAQELQDQMVAAQPWSKADRDALRAYTDEGYSDINRALYKPETLDGLDEAERAEVAAAIQATRKALRPLPAGVQVFRSTSLRALGLGKAGNPADMVGSKFQNRGFSSTALDIDAAVDAAENAQALVRIDVPEGYPAAYVDELSVNQGEHELLLDAGMRLEFVELAEPYKVGPREIPVLVARVVTG